MAVSNRIARTRHLSSIDLSTLIRDEILAIIVEDYCASDVCDRLSARVSESSHVEPYTHEVMSNGLLEQRYYGVDRLGLPFNLLYNAKPDDIIIDRYYEQARTSMEALRSFSAPALSPIDKLRLELDEHFPEGASVASFQGRKMLAGIARITKSHLSHLSAEQPHFDALPQRYATLEAQLAANIYLRVPKTGGELEVWDVSPMKPLTKPPQDWRAALPPSIKIAPKKGELILFNCRKPHAICTFDGADRVTAQIFIGYESGKPLQLWN